MSKLCDNDDVTVNTPSSCQFCLFTTKKLYCCPKCSKFYCSLKCYKSREHNTCSEKFYKEQIGLKIGEKDVVSRVNYEEIRTFFVPAFTKLWGLQLL